MENFKSYGERDGCYLQNLMLREEHHCFLDFRNHAIFCMYLLQQWSFEYLLEDALFYPTQHLCGTSTTTATTQSCLLQDEHELGDARLEVYIRSFLAALERNYHGGEKELKGELGRDAGEKKHNRSEEKPLVLTFELVSQYFCMPIKRAAEELNVGLTILKKRCREIGIPRWPHRKVKSLETLIKNAQELGKPMIEVEMLQRKKKLIEESPGHIELDEATMVLRQACFKEKFKRRRLMAIEG